MTFLIIIVHFVCSSRSAAIRVAAVIFIELALLGIRRFQQVARFKFGPGMNFIRGDNGSGKTTIREALLDTLFESASKFVPAGGIPGRQEACQAVLTFKTAKGEIYRLARDFIKNVGILFRYDAAKQKFSPVEKRKSDIQRWVEEHCGGISAQEAACFWPEQPSRPKRLAGRPSTEVAVIESDANASPTPEASEDSPDIQKRLKELNDIAARAEQAYRLEEQLSDAQSRGRTLRQKTSSLEGLEQELKGITEKLQVVEDLKESPEQLQQMLESFEVSRAERDADLQAMEQDCTLMEQQLHLISTDPIYKNNTFLAGTVFTTLSIAIGLFLPLPGLYQHLYLVGLLTGLGLMAVSVVMDILRHSRRRNLEERLQNKLKNMELLEARFRRENNDFFEILKKTQCQSSEGLKEKLHASKLLANTRQRLLEEWERALEGRTPEALREEFEENQRLVRELQEQIRDYEGVPMDLPSLRDEIQNLEKKLGKRKNGLPANPRNGHPTNGRQDPISAVLQSPLIKDPGALVESARRCFHRVSRGEDMDLVINHPSSSSPDVSLMPKNAEAPVRLEELSDGMLQQVFLSLHWGFLLALGAEYPFPVLLDEPLLRLDAKKQEVSLEILREISRHRQVILLSHMPYLAKEKEGENLIKLT